MKCYNDDKDWVYGSLEELLSDTSLTDEERSEIMSKGKTTVQVDATHQKVTYYRTNSNNSNTYRRSNSGNSSNNTNGNYGRS